MRPALSTLAGTAALVAWGMLFWGLLAPRLGVFHALPNAPAVTATLVEGGAASGTYFMPWPRDTPETFARFVHQHETGPFYRLSYVREGVNPNSPAKLLLGTLPEPAQTWTRWSVRDSTSSGSV